MLICHRSSIGILDKVLDNVAYSCVYARSQVKERKVEEEEEKEEEEETWRYAFETGPTIKVSASHVNLSQRPNSSLSLSLSKPSRVARNANARNSSHMRMRFFQTHFANFLAIVNKTGIRVF